MSYEDVRASGSFGRIENVPRYGVKSKRIAENGRLHAAQDGMSTFSQKKDVHVFERHKRFVPDKFGGRVEHFVA